ncbi:MAG: choice-of-anchor Q domain-containing protein [Acidimicrobiales bacterium]
MHQTFTVDSTLDSPLATTGSTSCVDAETTPKCSLRAAIGAADDDTGHYDEILIRSGTKITLSLGVLDLSNSMLIDGVGATVNGGGSEVFDEFESNDVVPAVQINGLTITGGAETEGDGGGIYCDKGALDLSAVTLSHDTASEDGGGAYVGYECQLWASHTAFSDDSASSDGEGFGGGLYVDGAAYITASSLGGSNSATGDRAYEGGGLFNDGTTVLAGSTADWNSPISAEQPVIQGRTVPADDVYAWGVGIYNDGAIDVSDSSIEHNVAPDGAGGVGIDNVWVAEISGSKISFNKDVGVVDDEEGGAGLADFGTSISLDHDTFKDDVMTLATDGDDTGGSIYTSGGSFSMTNSSILGSLNSGPSDLTDTDVVGGALFLDADVANIDSDVISGTTADADTVEGGDIFVESESCCGSTGQDSPQRGCGCDVSIDPTVLTDVTISDTSANGSAIEGGAIENQGGLELTDVSITSTTASSVSSESCDHGDSGVWGGVLDMEGGFGLTDVSIDGTAASASLATSVTTPSTIDTCVYGGAVYNEDGGTAAGVSITDTSAIASGGDGGVFGGAWYNDDSVTIRDTQILGVTARADDYVEGGGFDNWDYMTATNFTVGDVKANVPGGVDATHPEAFGSIYYNAETAAIVNGTFGASTSSVPSSGEGDYAVANGNSGQLQLTNSTIGGDSVSGPKGDSSLLYVQDDDVMSLLNTVVDDPGAPAEDCIAAEGGTIDSEGHNIDGGSSCSFDKPGDLVNTNPKLMPLANNGGSVETEALTPPAGHVAGSPAINAGTNAGCPAFDARGVTRPQDGTCDVGAYEVAADGYWLTSADGKVFHFGAGRSYGSAYGLDLQGPIVGIAATPDHMGYWQAGSDGGVFTFGDAHFEGSLAHLPLAAPIVGIAATADNGGYWLVGAEGHVYPFGDAKYYGSENYTILHERVVGIVSTPDGGGYWLATSTGRVLPFGDAKSHGSASTSPSAPVVGIASTPNGTGYWLVTSTGRVFAYGNARSWGSLPGSSTAAVTLVPTPDGLGYWIVSSNGSVSRFGDAKSLGSVSHVKSLVSGGASANY